MERRAEERLAINLSLTCRIPASPCRATIHDISRSGCKLEVPGMGMELGGTALMDLPGAAKVTGRIMWIDGRTAGVKFERTLSKAAAIALGLDEPDPVEAMADIAPRDKNRNGLLRHWFRRLTACFS